VYSHCLSFPSLFESERSCTANPGRKKEKKNKERGKKGNEGGGASGRTRAGLKSSSLSHFPQIYVNFEPAATATDRKREKGKEGEEKKKKEKGRGCGSIHSGRPASTISTTPGNGKLPKGGKKEKEKKKEEGKRDRRSRLRGALPFPATSSAK